MRVGMQEGCTACVSIQTCCEHSCRGQTSAAETPIDKLRVIDHEITAEETRQTPQDMEVREDVDAMGVLDGADITAYYPHAVTAALGLALIGISFALEGGTKEVTRGLGVVLGGIGIGSAISLGFKSS